MPRFSVVVPVYNAEKYLEKCITSVLTQSFDDIELILVDDGSPDGSGRICDSFAATDNRVKVIHQQNQGHITARMNGVKASTGEYILFLDSDDWFLPDAMQTANCAIERYGCDMLLFRLERGGVPCADFFGGERENVSKADYYTVNLDSSALNSLVIRVVKRGLFDNADISSFKHFINSEDLLLSLQLVNQAKKISYIPSALYSYRENENGITATFNKNALNEFVKSRAVLWAEIQKLGLDNESNTTKLNTAFMRRAADAALQISRDKNMKFSLKKEHYKKITDMPFFKSAVHKFSSADFGLAKRLRIKLLKNRFFTLIFITDNIRNVLS